MKRVGLYILLELWLRSKRWILDNITIHTCSNTVGKWVGAGYGSDFWEAHCTTTFTEHPRWMGRLLRLDTNDTRLHKFNNSNMKTEFTPPLPHHKPQVDERAHHYSNLPYHEQIVRIHALSDPLYIKSQPRT
jgi:hypothetical protein